MAQIIREIRVDVSQPNVFQAIVAKQLDCNSRFLKITLVDFGVKIEVPKTAKVTINGNRPDGQSKSFKGVANNDGTITVPLAQWMLEVAGELKCDVSVINTTDNKRLTSTDFYVNVQEAANKSTDISENPDGEIRVITPVNLIDENSGDDEYPSAKAVYELDNITKTASGNTITIDSASAPLQNLKLFGKTTQNGTPTPSAPVPLVSVGDSGSFEVGVYGGNLWKTPPSNTSTGVVGVANADGSYTLNGTAGNSYFVAVSTEFILPKGTYRHACDKPTGTESVMCFVRKKGDSNVISGNFTLAETTVMTAFIQVPPNATVNGTIYPKITIGTQVTPFEPCNKQTLTMPYTLRGVGDVKDEVDFNRGVLIQKVGSVDLGTSTWLFMTGNRFTSGATVNLKKPNSKGEKVNALCSHYAVDTFDNAYKQAIDHVLAVPSDGTNISIVDKSYTDATALKTALSGVICYYELETPQEIPLTETELNAYRHLMTNKPNTTILNSDGADMEISYYVNKPNAQAIGSLHEQINKDYFKLQQAIVTTGGSTL